MADLITVNKSDLEFKYTPDQMHAFDVGRGKLLGDEYNKADNIDAGLVAETQNLTGTQKEAFDAQTNLITVPKDKVSDTQPSEDGLITVTKDEMNKAPDWGPWMQEAMSNAGVSLLNAPIMAGAGIASKVGGLFGHPEIADPAFKLTDELSKAAQVSSITDQQRQNATFAQKAAAMAPMLAAGIAVPEAAPSIFAATSTSDTGRSLINQGASTDEAQQAAITSGLGAAVMTKIPLLAGSLPKAVISGAGANVAGGTLTDAMIHGILSDKPDLAKQYDPFDPEKRALDALSGGIFGAGAHTVNRYVYKKQIDNLLKDYHASGSSREFLAQSEAMGRTTGDLQTTLDGIIGTEDFYKPPEGMTHDEALAKILSPIEETTSQGGIDVTEQVPQKATMDQVLSLIANSEKLSQDPTGLPVRAQAAHLLRLAKELGIDQAEVQQLPKFDTGARAGEYDVPTDTANVGTNAKYSTYLHEIEHSITHDIIFKMEDQQKAAAEGKTIQYPEHIQKLVDKMHDLDALFGVVKNKMGIKPEDVASLHEAIRKARANENVPENEREALTPREREMLSDNYWARNLHEFVSSLHNKQSFVERLSDMKLHPDELNGMYPAKEGRPQAKNMYTELKNAYREALGKPIKGTMLDVLLEHNLAFKEQVSGATRTSLAKGGEAAARSQDLQEKLSNAVSDPAQGALLYKIRDLLLKTAGDSKAFAMRLSLESPNPVWRDFVAENAQRIWDNKETLFRHLENRTDFKNMKEIDKLFSQDTRSPEQWLREEAPPGIFDKEGKFISPVKGMEDITPFGTKWATATLLGLMKSKAFGDRLIKSGIFGGKIIKKFIDESKQYVALKAKIYSEAVSHFEDFNKLSRKEQVQLYDEIISMNTVEGREMLKFSGLQWATPEMLKLRGLNDAQIKAYEGRSKGMDFLWETLNQIRRARGQEELPRIPGYMPDVFEGAFKVMLKVKDVKTGQERIAAVRGFKTSIMATRYIKQLESGRYDTGQYEFRADTDPVTGKQYRTRYYEDLSTSLTGAIQEHILAYRGALELNPDALAVIQRIEKDSMIGVNRHMLERSDVAGFIGDGGMKNSILETMGIGDPRNTKVLRLDQNYARSVAEHYANSLFLEEVFAPFMHVDVDPSNPNKSFGRVIENLKVTKQYLSEYSLNFVGNPVNHLKILDDFAQRVCLVLGQDPLLYKQVARQARNALSLITLRGNPGFYLSNYVQPTLVIGTLDLYSAARTLNGEATPHPASSFVKILGTMGRWDNDMLDAIKWARDNHVLDAQLEFEMRRRNIQSVFHKATGGDINPAIEEQGRMLSFAVAYDHFRQVMKDPMQARTAAQRVMEMTMVDYSREARPQMYQSLGTVGEAFSPFAVFRNAYLANFDIALDLIKNNPTKLRAYSPFLITQLTFLLTAGTTGLFGFAELEGIIQGLNLAFPSLRLPSLTSLMVKHHWGDAAVFGGLSAATRQIPGMSAGVNLSASVAAPTGELTTSALLPFLDAGLDVLKATGKAASFAVTGQNPPSWADLYAPGKHFVPGLLRNQYEKLFKGDYDKNQVAYKAGGMEGFVTRTPADERAIDYFGRMSIDETKRRIVEREINAQEDLTKNLLKSYTQAMADHAMGLPTAMTGDQITAGALKVSPGLTPEEFYSQVWDVVKERITTEKTRDAYAGTLQGTRKAYKRNAYETK